jgi:hypothetical protein
MKIASRFDENYKSEKCPKCLMISQNFLIIDDSGALFACLRCGCAFVPKFIRDIVDVKALLDIERECKCRFCPSVSKSKAGRISHERHCEFNPGEET